MEGTSEYWLTRIDLQRCRGFIYLMAFLVVVNQFRPLWGEKGLLPVGQFISKIQHRGLSFEQGHGSCSGLIPGYSRPPRETASPLS